MRIKLFWDAHPLFADPLPCAHQLDTLCLYVCDFSKAGARRWVAGRAVERIRVHHLALLTMSSYCFDNINYYYLTVFRIGLMMALNLAQDFFKSLVFFCRNSLI